MSGTLIIAEKPRQEPFIGDQFHPSIDPNPVCNPQLPQCPAGCGLLSIYGRRVACQGCDFELTLTADEARDLALAVSGIDPDLPIDLFLAEIARRELESVERELTSAQEDTDYCWEHLMGMQADLRHALRAYRESDRCQTSIRRQAATWETYVARLRGQPAPVPPIAPSFITDLHNIVAYLESTVPALAA